MNEITIKEMSQIQGGNVLGCFAFGFIFAVSVSTGSVPGAIGSGYYLATNCFN